MSTDSECGCNDCEANKAKDDPNPFERLAEAIAELDLINRDIDDLDDMLSSTMTELNRKRHDRKIAIGTFREAYVAFGDSVSPAFFAKRTDKETVSCNGTSCSSDILPPRKRLDPSE